MTTRRDVLIQSASLAVALPTAMLAPARAAPRKLETISLHLFQIKPSDAAQSCRAALAMGYSEIEVTYKELQECGPELARSPIKKLSVEAQSSDKFLGPGQESELTRIFDDAAKGGFRYVGMSYNGTESDGAMTKLGYLDRFRLYAERFNRAAEKARAAGLKKLLYHNMPFGFTPSQGTFGHQLVWDAIDRSNAAIQLDLYWVKVSGHNPAEFLKRLSGRVEAIHLKDMPAGMPLTYAEPPPADILDVGTGAMDWRTCLQAAQAAGVQHFSVEPPDVKDAAELMVHAKKSYDYLSKLQL